jgi:Tol biopolymer transport system component
VTRILIGALLAIGVVAGPAGAVSRSEGQAAGRIAFVRSADVYVMNADGTAQRRLTRVYPRYDVDGFAWSPDATRIAFIRDGEELAQTGSNASPGHVFVVAVAGGRLRRMTHGRKFDLGSLGWSGDGSQLAYTRRHPGPESAPRVFVTTVADQAERGLAPKLVVLSADWSPDGRLLAAATYFEPGGVVTIRVSDGEVRRITMDQGDASPQWSPDGRMLLFVRTYCGSAGCGTEIRTTGLLRSSGRRLARGSDDAEPKAPSWSPDGTHVVFVRGDDIWLMNADGSGKRRLTAGPALDSEPAWSADGAEVAFTRFVSRGENYSIYAVGADGRGLRRLTKGPYDGSPAWSPTG